MLEAVIFDKDGVLMITEGAYHKAHQQLITKYGGNGENYSWDDHKKMMGWHGSERAPSLIRRFNLNVPVHDFLQEYRKEYTQILQNGGIVVPDGTRELISELRKEKIKYAIGTGGSKYNVTVTLEQTGLAPLFDIVVCADDVAQGKPHPEAFQLAADRLGVNHKNCVVIGDSKNDIIGAKAAGMKAIGIVDPNYDRDPEMGKADLEVSSIKEISVALLRGLFGS